MFGDGEVGVREIVVDLGEVTSRELFQREVGRHFSIAADHDALWSSLLSALANRREPAKVRFAGWAEFQTRMPNYARRLRRLTSQVERMPDRGGVALGCFSPRFEFS